MLEVLLILLLLFVFAPLWIALIYVGAILLLYVVVFVVAGTLAAIITLDAGGSGGLAALLGLGAAIGAVRGVAALRSERTREDPQLDAALSPPEPQSTARIGRGPDGRFRRVNVDSSG